MTVHIGAHCSSKEEDIHHANRLDVFSSSSIVLMFLPGPATASTCRRLRTCQQPKQNSSVITLWTPLWHSVNNTASLWISSQNSFCIRYVWTLTLDVWTYLHARLIVALYKSDLLFFIVTVLFSFVILRSLHLFFSFLGGSGVGSGDGGKKSYVSLFSSYQNKTCMIVPVWTNFGDRDLISMSRCCQKGPTEFFCLKFLFGSLLYMHHICFEYCEPCH